MQNGVEETALGLLCPDDVARMLGISTQTLAAWRSTGRIALPFVKIGRLCRYRRADVLEFLRERTTTKTPQEKE